MQVALYHPTHGYYRRAAITTGAAGDFSTSSDVSPAFGRRLALQIGELAQQLGGRWDLIEIGPGRGWLAHDIVEGLADHAPAAHQMLARLVLVESSPAFQIQQRQRLAGCPVPLEFFADIARWAQRRHRGVVVANEWLDAFPVHQVVRRGDALLERHVALADGRFVFVDGPPIGPALRAVVERFALCRGDGWLAEICLELESVFEQLARALEQGAVLLVDYGLTAAQLADEEHSAGTLVAYHQHHVVLDLLARPGEQDLTAHLNWDQVEAAALRAGFRVVGRQPQDRFLVALGVVDDMVGTSPQALAARALVLPAGGGRRFQILGLDKQVGQAAGQTWRGLRLDLGQ